MEPVVVDARGWAGRLRGLIGRCEWPAQVALRLAPCRSVHTCGMRFAVDLVWLDRAGAVVRVDCGVRPWRLRWCRRARAVLEVRAGGAEVFAGPRRFIAASERRH
jgi:uncharacterized membrane protein (UPF0127 family)